MVTRSGSARARALHPKLMTNTIQRALEVTAPFVWEERPGGSGDLVWRYSANPIMGRRAIPCAQAVYNSAIVPFAGRYAGVFRADHLNGMPYLHVGWSDNGIEWNLSNKSLELLTDEPELTQPEYGYDPRICFIDDRYYITWCCDYHGPTIGVAWTQDFASFHRLENAFLPHNRNGVLFPKKINGNFAMLSRPSDRGHTPFGDIYYSESPDMCYWGRHRFVMSASDKAWWESVKIGSGAVPIETSEGWLLLYHGVRSTCNGFGYSMGVALLDLEKPWKVRCRMPWPLLMPEQCYEVIGAVPNVVFPCAAVHDQPTGRIAIYYGAADTHIAIAFAHTEELIEALLRHPV
jgi:beta-1,4-mannooligosaccharide/beta-1,4-mannosyl-N-acetylglucosamine phosphorylase